MTDSCVSRDRSKPVPAPWRNPPVVTSVVSGLLLLLGFVGGELGLGLTPQTIVYVAAVVIGGWFFGREALEELIKEREIGIELLMSVAAIVAGLLGQWGEAAMLVFLYSISEAAESYTEERARGAIRALMDLAPKTAWVIRDGQEVQLSIDDLVVGDRFIVRPGEAIPTDGEIVDGASSVNQAPVTGESIPVEKSVGDTVFAATLNGEGALTVLATKTAADNTLARIIELVEEAQGSKAQTQRFIERFGRRYSPAVLAIGSLIVLVPGLLGFGWTEWLSRATVFIVAAAPCALVISIPIALVAAIGTTGRQGILIKGGVHLERLAKVRVVALDKTGTLTRGVPEVTAVQPSEGVSAKELLSVAAALESRSAHPLAQAIIHAAEKAGVSVTAANDVQSLTGAGITGTVNGKAQNIGSPELFSGLGGAIATNSTRIDLSALTAPINNLQSEGNTVVLVGDASQILGIIAIADTLRPNAKAAVSALKASGIEHVIMLTGDNRLAGNAIGALAGVDEVRADLKPDEKSQAIVALTDEYGPVAMVGDGVNDAPALAAAHVGIAMGVAGSDVALETADVALMADDLSKLPYLMQFSGRTWRVIRQNIVLSILVISVLAITALTGSLSLPVAVLVHEISEFIVIASGLRLLRSQ
ncbi:MAG: cadmium-translocating P-type ATPase [Gammaproteobacteria bacterium]|nr:cadmium-translocating P-type ATPase [Gammaproteobacteria bacterium]